ncbi:DUF6252 family protein [Hymenobacter arizonensis]|uniref:Uncharacterized protein n=1 Tax=Hymenobacter arizonensis TaxID=1227077 RepID=A0A1I5SC58_HYMAR|nr:DUF6252 family protein [Hymenobacter arizonensis]SFP68300.1 hypothetical protein SAMN04515668_0008 [Hymenobacter arizonensis]
MNTFRSIFFNLVAGLALAAQVACSSDNKTNPTPDPAPGLSWTVDGAAVTTTTLQSQNTSATLSISGTLNPAGPVTSYVSLEMPRAVGTYTFSNTTSSSAFYSTSGPGTQMVYYAGANYGAGTVSGSGTIVVATLTATRVTGTFAFTGINTATGASKQITSGQFSVGL